MASSRSRSRVGALGFDVAGTASVNTEGSSVASEAHMAEGRRSRVPTGRVGRTAPLAGLAAQSMGDAAIDILKRRLQGQKGASLEFHVRNAERYASFLS